MYEAEKGRLILKWRSLLVEGKWGGGGGGVEIVKVWVLEWSSKEEMKGEKEMIRNEQEKENRRERKEVEKETDIYIKLMQKTDVEIEMETESGRESLRDVV